MMARGVPVLLCRLGQDVSDRMRRVRFHHWFPDQWLFLEENEKETATLRAVKYAYELLGEEVCENCPRRFPPSQNQNWYYMI